MWKNTEEIQKREKSGVEGQVKVDEMFVSLSQILTNSSCN
jgi:hypothetical protein